MTWTKCAHDWDGGTPLYQDTWLFDELWVRFHSLPLELINYDETGSHQSFFTTTPHGREYLK